MVQSKVKVRQQEGALGEELPRNGKFRLCYKCEKKPFPMPHLNQKRRKTVGLIIVIQDSGGKRQYKFTFSSAMLVQNYEMH